jgi:hypothetical protein
MGAFFGLCFVPVQGNGCQIAELMKFIPKRKRLYATVATGGL